MEVIIVTGLSGAGKSSAANALEDLGFYCIDNMPPKLIPQFTELASHSQDIDKIAVVTDARGGNLFKGIFKCMDKLDAEHIDYKILFLDCNNDILSHRFKANRRKHPLALGEYQDIDILIEDERKLLAPIREMADYIIDTSNFTSAQLRERIVKIFSNDDHAAFSITVISFGFKYGIPTESDLVLDVRCLDNPYYIESLKNLTGLDEPVQKFIESSDYALDMLAKYTDFLSLSIPLYKDEGKNELIISVGCTGGKHRSVFFAEKLLAFAKDKGYSASVLHRDITKLI